LSCITGRYLPSTLLSERMARVVADIGRYPSLARWRDYAEQSKVVRLDETLTIGGRELWLPGHALTTARRGGPIRYVPASVWIDCGPDLAEVSRWAKCRRIARALDATLHDGFELEWKVAAAPRG